MPESSIMRITSPNGIRRMRPIDSSANTCPTHVRVEEGRVVGGEGSDRRRRQKCSPAPRAHAVHRDDHRLVEADVQESVGVPR